jgi:hypothetical protein
MDQNQPARKVVRNEFVGPGCLVQGLGFLLLLPGMVLFALTVLSSIGIQGTEDMSGIAAMNTVLFFLGLLLCGGGASLVLWGYKLSKKTICSACGNQVEPLSRMCPTCHSPLS